MKTSRSLLGYLLVSGATALAVNAGDASSSTRGEKARAAAHPAATFAADDPHSWAFAPERDTFAAGALFDFRSLNEPTAGAHGFVQVSPQGDFLRGDGEPLRFWGVNFEPRTPLDHRQLAYAARFLAKRGVNMVRWHGFLNPKVPGSDAFAKPPVGPDDPVDAPLPALESIDAEQRDFCWRLVAAMRREGIYVTLSPYWAVNFKHAHRFGLPGSRGPDRDAHGLLFFEPRMQAAYKQWLRDLLLPPNPYTGIPLVKDPAVAVLQLQNEDSLLFWTVDFLHPDAALQLAARFGRWLTVRHGSLAAARDEWGPRAAQPSDDWSAGIPTLLKLSHYQGPPAPGLARRLADQLEFYATTMRDTNAELVRFVREDLGVRAVLNANNWRTANGERLHDAERWSYLPATAIAANRYYAPPHAGNDTGWAVEPGQRFASISALRWAHAIPAAMRQIEGRPTIISEGTWVMPTRFRAEGPLVMAAYQSLSGVDAFYWFSFHYADWTQPTKVNDRYQGAFKWTSQTPDVLGLFPATSLLFRRGDLQRGAPVVEETRALQDVWAGEPPAILEEPGYDPNRDPGDGAPEPGVSRVPTLAYLVGPVQVRYTGHASEARLKVADLAPWIDARHGVVRANTGEIELDYHRGLLRVNSPRAQGVTGFVAAAAPSATRPGSNPLATTDVSWQLRNEYAHALAVSLDDAPLARSGRILIQLGTTIRPTGWRTEPARLQDEESKADLAGEHILALGAAPWRIEKFAGSVTVRNARVTKATVCDVNALPLRDLPLRRKGDHVTVDLPADALYVVLR